MKELIDIKTLTEIDGKLEIKLGEITSVEKLEKSDKMLKMIVNFGDNDVRTVMTNIGNKVNSDELLYAVFPFITNLPKVKLMGIESQAMIIVPTIGGVINLAGEPGSDLKLM